MVYSAVTFHFCTSSLTTSLYFMCMFVLLNRCFVISNCLGYGEEKGGITSLLHNRHPTDPLPVVYFATFPWFLRIFLHTLTIRSAGKDIKPGNPQKCFACSCSVVLTTDNFLVKFFHGIVDLQPNLPTILMVA